MGVLIDIKEGGEIRETPTNVEVIRIARVDDLSGSTDSAMLWDALQTVGVPVIGDAHPDIGTIVCLARDAEPNGCQSARITLTYGIDTATVTPPAGDGDDTKSVTIFGSPVAMTKAPRAAPNDDDFLVNAPPGFTTAGDQIKTANVDRTIGNVVFERQEQNAATLRARTFVNKVNSGIVGPYGVRELRCVRIDSTGNDTAGYRVRYEFAYDPVRNHTVEIAWDGRGLNIPAHDANSRKDFQVYDEADFSLLGLDFTD